MDSLADQAHADFQAVNNPPKPKRQRLPQTPERIAHNARYAKIMADRRAAKKEMKAAGFAGTIPEWKAHKASLVNNGAEATAV